MSKITKFVFASDNHGELACQDSLAALYQSLDAPSETPADA